MNEGRLALIFYPGTRKPMVVNVIRGDTLAATLSIDEVKRMACDIDHLEVAYEHQSFFEGARIE